MNISGGGFDEDAERVVRVAIFSTYPPQACGIGAFSFDVRSALLELPGIDDISPVVVADERSNALQPEALAMVSQEEPGDYVRAARLLGRLDIDVVLLEHEFGIFGGADGEYVLSFAQQLVQPLVVTLHTVLSQPSPHQLRVLTELCDQAERVIVMTDTARRLLVDARASVVEKIRVVPHGAPAVLGRRREYSAADRNVAPTPGRYERVQSRLLLSTFGLLSAGKGLETAIEALPLIIERHPEVRSCRARGSLSLDRRAGRSARGDRRLPDAVPQSRADRVWFAHICDRCRLRRSFDSVLVCAGHARLRRRPDRAVQRPTGDRRGRVRVRRAARAAGEGARGVPPDRFPAHVALRRVCDGEGASGSRELLLASDERSFQGDRLAFRPDRFSQLKRLADFRQQGNER